MERTFHMLLYRTFHAQRNALRPHLGELGLGAGQPKVLGYLVRNGASRQRQLAEYCEIDPAAISRMLDSLQRGGFVERQPGKGNLRYEEIVVTDRGREAYEVWQGYCREMEEQMLAGFSQEERTRFADYLGRAYRNLKGREEEV
ncbi:MAG TPA: MarR family transcriptional regulator [Candidatus Flavonifractor merdavium]|nr:MarR family transcriptional regulator [Candidatus Flavonifractor merdavium]